MAAFRCIKYLKGSPCEGFVVFEEKERRQHDGNIAMCPQCHAEYELVRSDDGWQLEDRSVTGRKKQ